MPIVRQQALAAGSMSGQDAVAKPLTETTDDQLLDALIQNSSKRDIVIEAAKETAEEAAKETAPADTDLSDSAMSRSHNESLIHIYEISPVTADLDNEYQAIMSQAKNLTTSKPTRQDKAGKVQKIEQAIKHQSASAPCTPAKSAYGRQPVTPANINTGRFCRKPTRKLDSVDSSNGSPTHSSTSYARMNGTPTGRCSVNSLDARISLPMDSLSKRLFNPAERSQTSIGVATSRPDGYYRNKGSCFTGRGSRSRHYVIHPDWVSENLAVQKVPLTDRSIDFIDKVKRSQSAPPPNRNIITWEKPTPKIAQ